MHNAQCTIEVTFCLWQKVNIFFVMKKIIKYHFNKLLFGYEKLPQLCILNFELCIGIAAYTPV